MCVQALKTCLLPAQGRADNEYCDFIKPDKAIVSKELLQLRRDRMTFAMVVMIPLSTDSIWLRY